MGRVARMRRRIVAALLVVAAPGTALAVHSALRADAAGVSISGAMEGVRYLGSWSQVRLGFSVALPAGHAGATVTLAGAGVSIAVACLDRHTQTVGLALGAEQITIPARDPSWH